MSRMDGKKTQHTTKISRETFPRLARNKSNAMLWSTYCKLSIMGSEKYSRFLVDENSSTKSTNNNIIIGHCCVRLFILYYTAVGRYRINSITTTRSFVLLLVYNTLWFSRLYGMAWALRSHAIFTHVPPFYHYELLLQTTSPLPPSTTMLDIELIGLMQASEADKRTRGSANELPSISCRNLDQVEAWLESRVRPGNGRHI